jgi:hypothetical protein
MVKISNGHDLFMRINNSYDRIALKKLNELEVRNDTVCVEKYHVRNDKT